MGLQGREQVPPHLYYVPCHDTVNYFDTIPKAQHITCNITFLITSAIYPGILPLPRVRPFPSFSYNTCMFTGHLHMGRNKGSKLQPEAEWVPHLSSQHHRRLFFACEHNLRIPHTPLPNHSVIQRRGKALWERRKQIPNSVRFEMVQWSPLIHRDMF